MNMEYYIIKRNYDSHCYYIIDNETNSFSTKMSEATHFELAEAFFKVEQLKKSGFDVNVCRCVVRVIPIELHFTEIQKPRLTKGV